MSPGCPPLPSFHGPWEGTLSLPLARGLGPLPSAVSGIGRPPLATGSFITLVPKSDRGFSSWSLFQGLGQSHTPPTLSYFPLYFFLKAPAWGRKRAPLLRLRQTPPTEPETGTPATGDLPSWMSGCIRPREHQSTRLSPALH